MDNKAVHMKLYKLYERVRTMLGDTLLYTSTGSSTIYTASIRSGLVDLHIRLMFQNMEAEEEVAALKELIKLCKQ